jgi:hypothetical protein
MSSTSQKDCDDCASPIMHNERFDSSTSLVGAGAGADNPTAAEAGAALSDDDNNTIDMLQQQLLVPLQTEEDPLALQVLMNPLWMEQELQRVTRYAEEQQIIQKAKKEETEKQQIIIQKQQDEETEKQKKKQHEQPQEEEEEGEDGWEEDEFDLGDLSGDEDEMVVEKPKAHDAPPPPPKSATKPSKPLTTQEKLDKLAQLEANLVYLALWNSFGEWKRRTSTLLLNLDDCDTDNMEALVNECQTLVCSLLLQFPSPFPQPTNDGGVGECDVDALAQDPRIQELHGVIWTEYTELRQMAKALLSQQLQWLLKEVKYPTSEGCATLVDQYRRDRHLLRRKNRAMRRQEAEARHDQTTTLLTLSSLSLASQLQQCCQLSLRLQSIHEHILTNLQPPGVYQPWKRLDAVTELCRPIVTRVQFHFLHLQSQSQSPEESSDPTTTKDQSQSKSLGDRHDRLVDWLLSYIRGECVMGSTTDADTTHKAAVGPLDMIRKLVDPLLTTDHDGIFKYYENENENENGLPSPQLMGVLFPEETKIMHQSILVEQSPPPPPHRAASIYFLREMLYLTRSTLRRAGNGGNGNGNGNGGNGHGGRGGGNAFMTILSDDKLFGNAMQRMLEFDQTIWKELQISLTDAASVDVAASHSTRRHHFDIAHNYPPETQIPYPLAPPKPALPPPPPPIMTLKTLQNSIPRVSGLFITSQRDRFQRWLELEHDYVVGILARTPLPNSSITTISLDKDNTNNTNNPVSTSTSSSEPRLNEFCETTIALLQSLHHKCQVAFAPLLLTMETEVPPDVEIDAETGILMETTPTSTTSTTTILGCLSTEVPQCMELLQVFVERVYTFFVVAYMDAVRAWAKSSLRTLQQWTQHALRPCTYFARKQHQHNIMSNHPDTTTATLLPHLILKEWCRMMVGLQSIAWVLQHKQAVFWAPHSTRVKDMLHDLAASCTKLSIAMMDELVSSMIEWWMVDDPHVASYIMRLPHMLQMDYFGTLQEEEEDESNDEGDGFGESSGTTSAHSFPRSPMMMASPESKSKQRKKQRATATVAVPPPAVSRELVELLETMSTMVQGLSDMARIEEVAAPEEQQQQHAHFEEGTGTTGHEQSPLQEGRGTSSHMAHQILHRLGNGVADKVLEGLYSDSSTGLPEITNPEGATQIQLDVCSLGDMLMLFDATRNTDGNSFPSPNINNTTTTMAHEQGQGPHASSHADAPHEQQEEDADVDAPSSDENMNMLGRVMDTVNLMALEPTQAKSLRDALRGLVVGGEQQMRQQQQHEQQQPSNNAFRNVFDRMEEQTTSGSGGASFSSSPAQPQFDRHASYQVDEAVLQEAESMLHAKHFTHMNLNDALHVLNQRGDICL